MDDPNITMKEYIMLKEENARKCRKVFNWETAKYGRFWYEEDIHDLRSVENEFPAVVFNDSLTLNETLSCELTNLYVPFGIPLDPKRYYKDGDCARMLRRPRSKWVEWGNPFSFLNWRAILHMTPLPPRDQRHLWLRYQDLAERMRMEFILEFFSTCRIGDEIGLDVAGTLCFQLGGARRRSERLIPDKGDLSDYWVEISSGRDFFRGAPSYTYIRDPVWRLCHRHADRRKNGARLSGGHFTGHLVHHFGLVSDDRLRGLLVMARELPLIDMSELVKLNICMEIGDDWAWVVSRLKRQRVVAAGAAEDALVVDEGAQADLAPVQAPQLPPPPPAAGRTMPQRLGRLEEEIQGLRRDVRSLGKLVKSLITGQGRVSTWMISCMTQIMEASGQTYQAFDETFQGSSLAVFE
ncbi:hypothetical protein Tco_0923475 [Tanacetum coccineum]|uniref:Aminotransferase-like plant mobile domain-containing protein n=1 Tax=Tanacetum coccineum TaxID=301880 RepID=A0ABQ5D188_9ASTR